MFTTGKHTYTAAAGARIPGGPHGPGSARRPVLHRSTPVQRLRDRFGYGPGGSGDPDAGFTLIEAIVSFVIFAIVIAAAVLAIVAGISTSNNNRDRVTAANVAQQALAVAQSMPLASLTAAPSATITSTVGQEPYTIVRNVGFAQAAGSAAATSSATACPTRITQGQAYWMHVAVTVTWPGANGRSVQMDTVRSC